MPYSIQINCQDAVEFIQYWSDRYEYPNEHLYADNIGAPLTAESRRQLYEWKNGGILSGSKRQSVEDNYPLDFDMYPVERYLDPTEGGGAIWNIFYLHCRDPNAWPIFDQHTYRAMRYIQTGEIHELGSYKPTTYNRYLNQYLPFLADFQNADHRDVDKALFAFGQCLSKIKMYL